jgi:hypothetical protein
MSRNITAGLQTKLAGRKLFLTDLIELHLDTPLYFTTTNINLIYNSPTSEDSSETEYLAQGQFIGYGSVIESADLRVGTMEMTFTAVDSTMVAVVLNNDYIDKRVVIYRAVLNDNYSFTNNDVFMIFDGFINGYNIREERDTAVLTLECSSQFADFERTNGRRTNPSSQKLHFATDRGMDFSPQIVKDIKWGRS